MSQILAIVTLYFASLTFAQSSNEIKQYFSAQSSPKFFLKTVYEMRNFEPIFGQSGAWKITNSDLNEINLAIKSHGLNSDDYQVSKISTQIQSSNPADLAGELFLAENIIGAVIHVVTGRIDPRLVSDNIKYLPKDFTQWSIFSSIAPNQIAGLFDQLAPKNDLYLGLKKILIRLKEIDSKSQWAMTAKPENRLSMGDSDSLIASIKIKLNFLGYEISNENTIYDEELDLALKSIQKDLSSPIETGLSKGSKVWRVINTDIKTRIQEVEMQLEKVRWLPDSLGSRYAVANLANQMFYVHDSSINGDSPFLSFKAIGGQLKRKTPVMKDRVVSVIMNPTWTVPMSIFFNDKLPILKNNPNYLAKNGFKIISMKTDQEIDPATIDWNTVTRSNIDFQLVQNPSYSNALGVVKFPMTNKFSIYLHDTGDRQLFKNNFRLISSGCVRLEKPLDLAEYLLANTSWTRPKIEELVAKPGQIILNDTPVRLSKPLDVYILVLTVQQTANKIHFFEDYYGQDILLYNKLVNQSLLKKPSLF